MDDGDFCQMFLYSLINLICFLLTVIFLTTLYNVNSKTKLLHIDQREDFESYGNSYTATAVIFTFNKIYSSSVRINQVNNGTVEANSEDRYLSGNINADTSGLSIDTLRKIMLLLFVYSKALIQIIVLTVYLSKSVDLQKTFEKFHIKEEGVIF